MSTSVTQVGGCSRCGEYECICGDPAVEAWIAEQLAQDVDADDVN